MSVLLCDHEESERQEHLALNDETEESAVTLSGD